MNLSGSEPNKDRDEEILENWPLLALHQPREMLVQLKMRKHDIYRDLKASEKELFARRFNETPPSKDELIGFQKWLIDEYARDSAFFFALFLACHDLLEKAVKAIAKNAPPPSPDRSEQQPRLRIVKA